MPHMDAAFNLAFWIVRSSADADDVVQEAYLRAFRAFKNFSGGDMRPWLLAIVRNTAYRLITNRRRSHIVVSLDETTSDGAEGPNDVSQLPSDEPSAEACLIGAEDKQRAMRALEGLPPALREVLVLREIEALSYRDISDVTGLPIGTVMSRLSRARDALRQAFKTLLDKDEANAL